MPSKAKTKGNSFERIVAEKFCKAYDDNFIRVPNSGAFTGGANLHRVDKMTAQQRRVFQGDIIPPEKLSSLKLECKSYKTIAWHQIVQGSCKQLDGWIAQATDDKLVWLLLFKINRGGIFMCWDPSVVTLRNEHFIQYQKYRIADFDQLFSDPKNVDKIQQACTTYNALHWT